MLQKLGTAMKKMAQRSMMRGNRSDAQTITDHGLVGMRSNLQNQSQNTLTQHANVTASHDVSAAQATQNVKAKISGKKTGALVSNTSDIKDEGLGGNILDALK